MKKHGTLTAYYKEGCRCNECKACARDYRKRRRDSIRRWERSRAGKESRRRYEQSVAAKGRRSQRKTGPQGKASSRAWVASPSGKASRTRTLARYAKTAKGKATVERHMATPAWREGLRRNKHRRRARERNVQISERIDRGLVYERDKGICQECFAKVDPDRWEMDHITPLGPGDHSWTNVQVLCRSCNRKKIGSDRQELKRWREKGGGA